MAKPVVFQGANGLLVGGIDPPVPDLAVRYGEYREDGILGVHVTPVVTSCWELDDDELAEVMRTKRIYVTAMGQSHPPLSIGTSLVE